MAEQPPQLLEQLATSPTGAIWKARQADGVEVLATHVLIHDEASREVGLDRLRRLARIPTIHLARIRGWWADSLGLWIVSDLDHGLSLPELPGGGYLSPQQAAAISFGLLDGLQALHSEGLNHGALGPENLRILSDGNVVLTGHQLATLRFPGQGELALELREAGRLVCQAFGITPERDPRAAPRAIEHAAPALVVTARAIAAGNMGSDIRAAIGAMRETAGPLAGAERLSLGTGELASLVATRTSGGPVGELRFKSLAAPIGPPVAASAFAPAPAPPSVASQPAPVPAPASSAVPGTASPAQARRSWEERNVKPLPHEYEETGGGPNLLLIGGGLVALLVVGLGIYFGRGLVSGSTPTHTSEPIPTSAARAATPTPKASPIPGPIPTFAPPSAGSIRSVALTPGEDQTCSVGGRCTVKIVIHFPLAAGQHDVLWTIRTFDPCTYSTTDVGTGKITADGAWDHTDGYTPIAVPAVKGQVALVAISGPDAAASPPLLLGNPGC